MPRARLSLFLVVLGCALGCNYIGPGAGRKKTKPQPKRRKPARPVVQESPPKTPAQTRGEVNEIMRRFEEGRFTAEQSPSPSDGWTMVSRGGRRYYQSYLINQATLLVPYGAEAVPELVFWLDHEEQYMRFLARYALGLITEVIAEFPYFESREQLRRDGVIKRAQDRYQAWYDAR